MGSFTALDDPLVAQKIDTHMQTIVKAIRSEMEPIAVILRGSFGRNEGSVLICNQEMLFLSDYEIDVATFSPNYRSRFKKLSARLTEELGVQTSLRWIRPDFMEKQRIGPFIVGPVPITISLYESRYGSRTLYGDDFISRAPILNPDRIRLDSGIYLVLNRMAESMVSMPTDQTACENEIAQYYWINKTILACAESLLLLWGQYHFSYQERWARFSSLSNENLLFLPDGGQLLFRLVERATEYKLRPRTGLYMESVYDTWQQIIPVVDLVFRHLLEGILRIRPVDYGSFPEQFLQTIHQNTSHSLSIKRIAFRLVEAYRSLRAEHFPAGIFSKYYLSQIVYAIVPLLFYSCSVDDFTAEITAARRWMRLLGPLKTPSPDLYTEREYLRRQLGWFWKVYCYGKV